MVFRVKTSEAKNASYFSNFVDAANYTNIASLVFTLVSALTTGYFIFKLTGFFFLGIAGALIIERSSRILLRTLAANLKAAKTETITFIFVACSAVLLVSVNFITSSQGARIAIQDYNTRIEAQAQAEQQAKLKAIQAEKNKQIAAIRQQADKTIQELQNSLEALKINDNGVFVVAYDNRKAAAQLTKRISEVQAQAAKQVQALQPTDQPTTIGPASTLPERPVLIAINLIVLFSFVLEFFLVFFSQRAEIKTEKIHYDTKIQERLSALKIAAIKRTTNFILSPIERFLQVSTSDARTNIAHNENTFFRRPATVPASAQANEQIRSKAEVQAQIKLKQKALKSYEWKLRNNVGRPETANLNIQNLKHEIQELKNSL